ncbi:MAG: ATP/GTP-binding protein [Sporichthyaceae bacterium]|nr:ATP/GTP-binding protein [Sporichthyaceae bacterium]
MDFAESRSGRATPTPPQRGQKLTPVKIVIAGGFGAGKTTLVGSVSEITPLTTEAKLTTASIGVDDTAGVQAKTTTTVAMDFGRIPLDRDLILYLFGTPGQDRFWFMWDDLVKGAIGAVVLADTRRLADCFAAVDYFEQRELPFVVAVNCFDGIRSHSQADVREALVVGGGTPILLCDARVRDSVKAILIELVQHALARTPASAV